MDNITIVFFIVLLKVNLNFNIMENKYSQFKIGDRAEIKHKITENDIEKFVNLTGDDNKLHIDKEYASKTAFRKPVAHGMLSASFISTIIGTKLPGDGALWYSQTLDFLLPVRVNDELTIIAEIINKNDRLNSIELKTEIFNQEDQKVISGIAQVKITEQQKVFEKSSELKEKKIILVLGATGGIGTAVSRILDNDGHSIALHYYNNLEKANQLASTFKNKYCIVGGDVKNETSILEIVEKVNRKLGKIDIFINCSAINIKNTKIENVIWEDFQSQLEANIKTNLFFVKFLYKKMAESKSGKFIFITSQVTENIPPTNWLAYNTAKYALNGFAKTIATELAQFGINVNLVSPGMTQTDLISNIPEKSRLLITAKVPLKRLADPEDVANAVSFLVSDKSNYITGETIRVNGGQTML
jgi:3-oxoacyl-[acyl-carrier protein] reductase